MKYMVSIMLLFWHKWLFTAKRGPLDFPSEESVLLSLAHEQGLGHMF